MKFDPPRKHPRSDFSDLPWVFSLQLQEPWSGEKPLRLEAKNISLGGLKFLSNHKVALFEELLFVIFRKKEGSELARIKGKVVRLEEVDTGRGEKTYGIAVEFLPDQGSPLEKHLPSA